MVKDLIPIHEVKNLQIMSISNIEAINPNLKASMSILGLIPGLLVIVSLVRP
jgi:hypothetical protein